MATSRKIKVTTEEEQKRTRTAKRRVNNKKALDKKIASLSIEEKNTVLSEMLQCRPQDYYRVKISRKYYDIVRKITLGVPITKISRWLVGADKEVFGEMPVGTLDNMLYSFKDHLVNRAKLGSFPSSVFDMIAERVEVAGERMLQEKEKMLAIQKSRLEHALIEEEDNLDKMEYRANVRAELRLFNQFTNEIIEKRQSLGLEVNMGLLPMGSHQQNNTLVQNLIVQMGTGGMDRLSALRQIKSLITQQPNVKNS